MKRDDFTASELENSFPADMTRRFREPQDFALLVSLKNALLQTEGRQRKRTQAAEAAWTAGIEALLANLVAGALNVIDPDRYVAVSFNRNDYAKTGVSIAAVSACRDWLLEHDYADVAPGFQRWDAYGDGKFGRRSRMRATSKMRQAVKAAALRPRSLTRPAMQIIQLRKPDKAAGPLPQSVEDSRDILAAVNDRLAKITVEFPNALLAAFRSEKIENEGEDPEQQERARSYAGDFTAISLYRVFKFNWKTGGRIYGGWWMSVPRNLRPHLKIDGAPVVELDYKALHPALLYKREGLTLPDDPYVIDGWISDGFRDLGKRTFNRLLNRDEPSPKRRLKIRAAKGDKDILGKSPFSLFLGSLIYKLKPIEGWFGTGEGIRLQYEDSLLAIDVLGEMERQSIAVLPIHDSFLVAIENEEPLRAAMERAFHEKYGTLPEIKRIPPASWGASDPQYQVKPDIIQLIHN